jgi:apolipoprotein N-acyltransferase
MKLRAAGLAFSSPLGRANRALAAAALRVAGLAGWPRRAAALAFGGLTALAFAPLYLTPLLAVGFSGLVLLLDGARAGPRPLSRAFAAGWFFGFGFFLVSLYWLAFSFFVQAEEFAWMAPFAVTGLPAFLALFTGAAAAATTLFHVAGARRILVFAAVYMVFEYARGHVLTGLPWNLPGQALAGTAAGAQTAAWYGVYGLSLVVVAIAALPARAADGKGVESLALALAATAALFAVGAVRLAAPGPAATDIALRIVQPNIPQREKIDGALWTRNLKRHVDLSRGAAPSERLFILWPENAAPYLQDYDDVLQYLARELPANATLIAGTVREEKTGAGARYYNSIAVLARRGAAFAPEAYYDKHHLAPFGEYLPLAGLLRAVGLDQLAPYEDGFTPGQGPAVVTAQATSFAPLICYETIFPGEIYPKDARPAFLATLTNDAWFGDTAGPRQHLDQARLRSIETGLPQARSANTGVSAVFDARGRLLARVPLYEAGRIDAALPGALSGTLYTRAGDSIFAALVLGVFFFAGGNVGRTRAPG